VTCRDSNHALRNARHTPTYRNSYQRDCLRFSARLCSQTHFDHRSTTECPLRVKPFTSSSFTPSLYMWLVPDSASVIQCPFGWRKWHRHTPQECRQPELEMCRRTRTALLVSGLSSSSGSGAIIGQEGERWGPYKGRQWSVWCGEWGRTRYRVGGTRSSHWGHGGVKGNSREVGKGKGKRKITWKEKQ
jgi:hypothetical protein